MTQHTNSPRSESREPIGLSRDLHRLKKDGGMTLAEMREFIRQLHGRKPSEVLGIVSASALIRALGESVLYLGIALAVLTIVPFLMSGDKKESGVKDNAAAAVNSETAASAVGTTDASVTNGTGTPPGADGSISAQDAEKAVKAMGLGETKTADPKKNPLDNLDNLLDDVK